MIDIHGEYGTARVFAEQFDDATDKQVRNLLNSPLAKGSNIRIMPDCHAGAGCVVGLTMTLTDKLCPNLVGVDIGCGMLTVQFSPTRGHGLDFNRLDAVIRENIPSGFAVHTKQHDKFNELYDLTCADSVDIQRALLSIGTLGGGNHFIEVSKSVETDRYYLIIHSGSRKLGLEIAAHYQKIATETCDDKIQKDLRYLTDENMDHYLHDMNIAQMYADFNRRIMAARIMRGMKWEDMAYSFTTTHNYIDFSDNVLRKGAVSARAGEMLLVPLNMRDGSLLCIGKGNADWNRSAPHGAGRILSRSQAKKELTLDAYQAAMKGIHSTCVGMGTIDESPMAYKDGELIEMLIEPTATVQEHLKPLYNFKAGGE